jgi:hypothetical protein
MQPGAKADAEIDDGSNRLSMIAGHWTTAGFIIGDPPNPEVLGYSTIQFGLMTATMTVMSVVGAYGGQALVTRTGFRPIAGRDDRMCRVSTWCRRCAGPSIRWPRRAPRVQRLEAPRLLS